MTEEAKRAAAALAFARECHAGQLDKAGAPYVEHLERVSRRLRERWPDATEEEVAAALLHDTIEDTGATRDDIAKRFTRRVAEIVAAVTRPAGAPYLDWIRDIAVLGDPGVLRVKPADLADNADPSRPGFPGRKRIRIV